MADDKCSLGFGDGFKFGLGFFTAGLIFYIIIAIITVALFAGVLKSMASGI
jgi:hypothetical protein